MFPLKGKLVDMTIMFSIVERSVHTTGKPIYKFHRLFLVTGNATIFGTESVSVFTKVKQFLQRQNYSYKHNTGQQ